MVELDPDAVAHVARVARLALSEAEREALAAEARLILGHFGAVLAAAGAEGADEPAGGAPRADEVEGPDGAEVEAIVGQFPRREGRLAKVPGGL